MMGSFARTEAATARGLGTLFRALPGPVQLALLVFALLAGLIGCSAAWIDQQGYTPSPNVCRHDQIAQAAVLGCVPPQTIPAAGWQR
jgi:hypothetical protein